MSAIALEVIPLPVAEVERALRFYVDRLGFVLDVDYAPTPRFRVVQLTPPGFADGLDPGRGDYASFASFSDPDGNTWVLQERGHRSD
jgi:catechol 2,3-dioxygenase-like lactoylglutathione lyase family enzyme